MVPPSTTAKAMGSITRDGEIRAAPWPLDTETTSLNPLLVGGGRGLGSWPTAPLVISCAKQLLSKPICSASYLREVVQMYKLL